MDKLDKLKKLETRIKHLEEANRSTLDALDLVVTLGGQLTRIELDQDPLAIFNEAKLHLKRLMLFRAIAFLTVNDSDFDFTLTLCEPESEKALIKKVVEHYISDGTFAWALRQTHAVQIPAKHFIGNTLVFHSLTTKSQVIGMFVGIVADNEFNVGDISSDLISIILFNCAQAIENSTLYNKLQKNTQELKTANEQFQREIIERQRAEEKQAQLLRKIESINQELKEFAYVVSHDLKAPLRAIGSLADWISSDYKEKLDEKGQELLHLLTKRIKRMHNLIEGVLQLSRIGHSEEEKVRINLNHLVKEVIEMIGPSPDIEIKLEDNLPSIPCEQTRMNQIFQNLINNAVKYMDKSRGQIKVGCAPDNSFWKFYISDNGPGIEKKYYNKIFQIFQTLKSRDEFESTGIGLSVVKKSVEMYGGRIWVESKVGQGSTFFFTLPRE